MSCEYFVALPGGISQARITTKITTADIHSTKKHILQVTHSQKKTIVNKHISHQYAYTHNVQLATFYRTF